MGGRCSSVQHQNLTHVELILGLLPAALFPCPVQLLYTAEMKRSMSEPLSSKQQAVEALISKLALESCQ